MKGQEKEDKKMVGSRRLLPSGPLGKHLQLWEGPAPHPITQEFLTSKGFISGLRRGWRKRKFQLPFSDKDKRWSPLSLKEVRGVITATLDSDPSPYGQPLLCGHFVHRETELQGQSKVTHLDAWNSRCQDLMQPSQPQDHSLRLGGHPWAQAQEQRPQENTALGPFQMEHQEK